MDKFITHFTSLLRYVPYIREEKAKVRRFVSNFPWGIRDRIEFDNPKMMDKAIRKAQMCYQQSKQKGDGLHKRWLDKKSSRLTRNTKGNHGGGNRGFPKGQANSKNSQKNSLRLKSPNESRTNDQFGKNDNEGTTRPPV